MAIRSINPATGEKLGEFNELDDAGLEERLARAARAFADWKRVSIGERVKCLERAGALFEREKERWARLMTQEMGKPIQAARDEVAKCAACCQYYVANAGRFLSERVVETSADRSFVRFDPVGTVLAIMPWNFPFWQVVRFAAPSLAAGNTALLKHASNVPQCASALEEIFRRAGFPEGVFQTLLLGSSKVDRVLSDSRVAAVTLTGSEKAGMKVAETAGRLLKKAVLELGGSDPFIVMPSAELEQAAKTAMRSRLINNGESCIAAKRFIVADAVADEFERRFTQAMKEARVGDPMDESVQVGPMATSELLETLRKQVEDSVRAGARVVLGGRPLERAGNYYAPTILTDMPKDSPAYREEIFGPVALLFRARNLDEALRLANDTKFGLGASFWSTDPSEQERFISEIEAGLSFVNGMVASDPRLPFGGVKHSGYGRELGEFGIHEFVNIKTVWKKDRAA